jgi:hypothetical protein
MMTDRATGRRWITPVSIMLLLWNLMGVGAFVSQWIMSAEQLATLPPEQQAMWASMPVWAWTAYAVAVFAGTGGAIGMVMRKNWAVPLFLLSFVAVLVQFSYPFIIAGGLGTLGVTALLFPAFIILVAVVQWRLAATGRNNNWLN